VTNLDSSFLGSKFLSSFVAAALSLSYTLLKSGNCNLQVQSVSKGSTFICTLHSRLRCLCGQDRSFRSVTSTFRFLGTTKTLSF